jgi:hypothetical protein
MNVAALRRFNACISASPMMLAATETASRAWRAASRRAVAPELRRRKDSLWTAARASKVDSQRGTSCISMPVNALNSGAVINSSERRAMSRQFLQSLNLTPRHPPSYCKRSNYGMAALGEPPPEHAAPSSLRRRMVFAPSLGALNTIVVASGLCHDGLII